MLFTLLHPYIRMQSMLLMKPGQSRMMTSFRELDVEILSTILFAFINLFLETIACMIAFIAVMQIVRMVTGQDTSPADQP